MADSFGLNKLCRNRFVRVIAHSHLSPILLIAVPLPTNHLRLERHWTSHRQDDAEFCLPAHHVSVSFGGFHERIFFDHWADARHFRKTQRVLGIGWDSSQPALDSSRGENQLACRHFDGIHRHSYKKQCAVCRQAADQGRHRFPTGRGRKNHARAAEFLQFSRGIRGHAVDIEIRSKLFRERGIARPASYCSDSIAKFLRELNSQMAKAADPLDGHKVARQRTAMTQSIECSNSGAHERRGLGSIKRFGNASQRLDRRDHELLIAPVVTDSGNLSIHAVNEIASPARGTSAILTAMPADADPFALPPVLYTSPDRVDDPNHFVSGHARVRYPGKNAFLRGYIAVTDSTRLDANPDLCRARLPDFTFDDFEVRTRLRYLHHFHLCHVPFLPLLRQWQTTLTRRHGLSFDSPAAASSITSATLFGCDNITTWLEERTVVAAFICFAMLFSCLGAIILSLLATMY